MRMNLPAFLFVVGAVAGCGGTSRVLQLGPDTYRTSAEAVWLSGAEEAVLETAANHCAGLGRQMVVQQMSSRPSAYATYAAATANFRCLAAGDPELRRPTLERAPNVVIEDRRRP